MRFAHIAAVALAAVVGVSGAQAQSITPTNFPASFPFPESAATLNGLIASNNQAAIRTRAWNLWQAMGTLSGQVSNGTNLAIWDTWWGSEEMFPLNPTCLPIFDATATAREISRAFIVNQFKSELHGVQQSPQTAPPSPSDFRVVSFNKFNPAYVNFIMTLKPGPNASGAYCYRSGASLMDLGFAFNRLNSASPVPNPLLVPKINEFPAPAIATKPVMALVKATGRTVLPVWQGPGDSTNAINPTPGTWKSCVVIDPNGTQAPGSQVSPTPTPVPGLACQNYTWASLSQLYSVRMNAQEAAAYNQVQGSVPQQPAVAGDFAVLVAMHVTTKETSNWTWQTFYWQPNGDTPQGFPGSKANQPAMQPAVLTNYAMCTAWSQNNPSGSNSMTVCFNPYLETSPGIPAGITSNCMSCHGTAQNGPNGNYPANYTKSIRFFTDPTYFAPSNNQPPNKFPYVITDFSWATAGAK